MKCVDNSALSRQVFEILLLLLLSLLFSLFNFHFFIIFNCLGYFIYIFGYLFLYFQSQAMGRPAMIIQVYSEKHKHRPHEAQGKLGKHLEKSVLL